MSRKILVVDDEESVRKSFLLALETSGYRVDTAPAGEEGVAMFEKESYDLVYLDLKMPGIDGVETLKRIRALNGDVPVYIVTAFHREFFDSLCGARKEDLSFELLRKPVERDQIIRITRGILEGAEAL
jgi:DNA-binding response OmpR family regulator